MGQARRLEVDLVEDAVAGKRVGCLEEGMDEGREGHVGRVARVGMGKMGGGLDEFFESIYCALSPTGRGEDEEGGGEEEGPRRASEAVCGGARFSDGDATGSWVRPSGTMFFIELDKAKNKCNALSFNSVAL